MICHIEAGWEQEKPGNSSVMFTAPGKKLFSDFPVYQEHPEGEGCTDHGKPRLR
jgi:hypothetical protein